MKAVLLAAGSSTRLRPLTDDTPKCLLSVAGSPILKRAIATLRACGVGEFVIVTGYLQQKVRHAVRAWFPGLEVAFVENADYASTNTSVSLWLTRPLVVGHPFLLLDGDILFERAVIDALFASGRSDCLALRRADDLGHEEIKAEIDGAGRIVRIGKEVPIERAAGESIGIELFSADVSERLFATLAERVGRRRLVHEYYEASFQQMIDAGVAIHAVDVGDAYCTEIDTPADLWRADAELSGREARRAKESA